MFQLVSSNKCQRATGFFHVVKARLCVVCLSVSVSVCGCGCGCGCGVGVGVSVCLSLCVNMCECV